MTLLSALGVCLTHSGTSPSPSIRAAMLIWQIDINNPEGPTHLLEAITPVVVSGHQSWRVTHYDADPSTLATNEYDLYEIDASTLRPFRSVMQTSEFRLEINFDEHTATLRKVAKDGNHVDKIPLTTEVKPEGPGFTVFVASLRLREAYTTRHYILDRWSGNGPSRLKQATLRVIGRKRVPTAMGTKDVFEVETRAADGSFRILEYVRTSPPYYPLRMEYTRDSKRIVSEVTSMILQYSED
jgi:hypothetical protein